MKNLKEKDIVNHFIQYWDHYFDQYKIIFCKKEFNIKLNKQKINSKVDLFAYKINSETNFRMPVLIECKYYPNNSSRDLLYELEKLITVRQYHLDKMSEDCKDLKICVLADELNLTTKNFMKNNEIYWFKYSLKQNEISEHWFDLKYIKL